MVGSHHDLLLPEWAQPAVLAGSAEVPSPSRTARAHDLAPACPSAKASPRAPPARAPPFAQPPQ
eukprot:15931394-Heterocapsa_arctica.AAC.1